METLEIKKTHKNTPRFFCEKCKFKCYAKSDWRKHLTRAKHKNGLFVNELEIKHKKSSLFNCSTCDKKYETKSGLWKHYKQCEYTPDTDKALIKELLIQNRKLQESIIELSSKTTIINSHNRTFNLHFFLNDTCKNAMNIGDFVSSIKPGLEELEKTGQLGYVDGISNIILNNLKGINTYDRPIHCSDGKRETLYIKDNNVWEKEPDAKPKLKNVIKLISHQNIKNISEWQKENPDCSDSQSKHNSAYLNIVSNSMAGVTSEEMSKNINKIISNIAKDVCIDKDKDVCIDKDKDVCIDKDKDVCIDKESDITE